LESHRSSLGAVFVIATVILILVGLTYFNHRFTAQNPGGNDFLSRWVGTRLFFTRGWNPYSDRVTQEIQELAYGRPAAPDEDQMLFVYPLYTILVIAPYAFFGEYALARALWMTSLQAMLVALVFMGFSLSRWRPPRWLLVMVLLFALLWYHGLRPVINGNPSVVVAVLITTAFLLIRSEQDAAAGFLLALSTIKPQMVILLILFILLWAGSVKRWTLVWSFLGSLILMIVGASLLIPGWLVQNITQVLSYPQYTLPGTPGAIFAHWLPGIGNQLGWLFTVLSASALIVEWRAALRKDFSWFYWTACLTLTLTNLIGIRTATENYVAMFPSLLLVLAVWDERWNRIGRWLVMTSLIILFVGLWVVFLNTVQTGDQPLQDPVIFFPLPIFLWISLYWVRWWAIHPPRVILDEFRRSLGADLV